MKIKSLFISSGLITILLIAGWIFIAPNVFAVYPTGSCSVEGYTVCDYDTYLSDYSQDQFCRPDACTAGCGGGSAQYRTEVYACQTTRLFCSICKDGTLQPYSLTIDPDNECTFQWSGTNCSSYQDFGYPSGKCPSGCGGGGGTPIPPIDPPPCPENGGIFHFECFSNTCTIVCSAGSNAAGCTSEGQFCGVGQIINFGAFPNPIDRGQSTTLSWQTIGLTSCVIDQGVGSVPINGSVVVNPAKVLLIL